jgi:hypothetical protein
VPLCLTFCAFMGGRYLAWYLQFLKILSEYRIYHLAAVSFRDFKDFRNKLSRTQKRIAFVCAVFEDTLLLSDLRSASEIYSRFQNQTFTQIPNPLYGISKLELPVDRITFTFHIANTIHHPHPPQQPKTQQNIKR